MSNRGQVKEAERGPQACSASLQVYSPSAQVDDLNWNGEKNPIAYYRDIELDLGIRDGFGIANVGTVNGADFDDP